MKFHPPLTLAAAAEILECDFSGEPDHPITGINEIHMVEPGDITFVDVEKYFKKALESQATTILINKKVEVPAGKALLISENPFTDFNRLLEFGQPLQDLHVEGEPQMGEGVKLGQNIVFGEDVAIGEHTQIGHGVVIASNVRIGARCRIHANVTIYENCILGDEVTINSGTVIGGEGFYFKNRLWGREKLLTKGRVVIGDHVDIGANCTIDRGVTGDTHIGDWTKIDNLVQVGHDVFIGKKCLIAAQVGISGTCVIEDEVSLWGQSGVATGAHIGKGASVMASSGVSGKLEAGKSYLGWWATERKAKLKELALLRRLPELFNRDS